MELKETKIYKYLKRNQFIYFTIYKLFNKEYKQYKKLLKYSKKTKEQIEYEMKLVADYWKCRPLHYIRYELFNKDLTNEELLDYIPPYYQYNFYNDKLYGHLNRNQYNNKLNLYKLLKARNVETPEVIAIYEYGTLKHLLGTAINIEEVLSLLSVGDKLFMKPVYGKGGNGIVVVKKKDNGYYIKDSKVTSGDICDSLAKNDVYVFQKGIIQRSDISNISPDSVNTLRVITQWRNGSPHLSVCVMRIGRNGNDVDNSAQGGVSVRVDENTGELYEFAFAEHGGGCFKRHPDTGFVFKGFKLENWDFIKQSILEYALKFPELVEIAWDIAVVDGKPLAIELNMGYGIDHLQCTCGGMRRVLKVYPNY